MGLVYDIFARVELPGNCGIGHVRYSTQGASNVVNAQPILINYSKGTFAIAHNGQIVNHRELRQVLEDRGNIFTTTSDTEIIAVLIAQEHHKTDDFLEAIRGAMKQLRGSYCLTILHEGKVYAVRDPNAIRPLVLGGEKGTYAVASESCALDTIDLPLIRDVKPAEIIVIDENGYKSHPGVAGRRAHCMFEYVYFSRPDSVLDGISVYEVRKNLGRLLSEEGPVDADLVIPVPNSGITAAIGYSEESGVPYSEGLMKNRYMGRTFIMPNQEQRDAGVKVKLNPIKSEVQGKNAVLIDDSIVRGTTQRRIVKILRDAGAEEIHVRISCPPIKHVCPYGIDMQVSDEFIATEKNVEEICKTIGADSLVYLSKEGLVQAIGLPADKICMACLTGDYPIKPQQTKLTDK
ncbi:Glutamine--fructose-6-phosphate aminotransferase [isomerizing] [uncultured archaeon]|nr:Glutamine--fructose-6-phosphate aminotransferase [isomerizing] [uncultured archaeon]